MIITVGYDFVEYLPKYWNDEAMNPIIHLDSLPAEVDAFYPVQVELVGNVKEGLDELSTYVEKKELWEKVKQLKSQLDEKTSCERHDFRKPG